MPLPVLAGLGIAQGLLGIGQSLIGGGQARRARRELEGMELPKTQSSQAISDYYSRANANPYESTMYRMQKQNIQGNTTQAIAGLQDRRSGLAGISSVVRSQNDALLRAGANAEQQQWARLADATRLKASDDQRVFNINQLMPFQHRVSLLSSKAAGANQTANAGISNIFGGLQTAAMGFMNNKDQSGF